MQPEVISDLQQIIELGNQFDAVEAHLRACKPEQLISIRDPPLELPSALDAILTMPTKLFSPGCALGMTSNNIAMALK